MATITKTTNLFPAEFIPKIFSKVAGHSTLAKLSKQEPIPFFRNITVCIYDGRGSIYCR